MNKIPAVEGKTLDLDKRDGNLDGGLASVRGSSRGFFPVVTVRYLRGLIVLGRSSFAIDFNQVRICKNNNYHSHVLYS